MFSSAPYAVAVASPKTRVLVHSSAEWWHAGGCSESRLGRLVRQNWIFSQTTQKAFNSGLILAWMIQPKARRPQRHNWPPSDAQSVAGISSSSPIGGKRSFGVWLSFGYLKSTQS